MASLAPGPLPPRIEEILSGLSERAVVERHRRVLVAASAAIRRLAELDLVRYEAIAAEGAPGVGLWEELAPVIRDTVMDVNGLLLVIREHFPAHPPGGLADTLTRVVEEAGGEPKVSASARRAEAAEAALRRTADLLAQEVTDLGERMRTPRVVADRWNLLDTLQTFRTRFREQISEMVYAAASAFAEVHRREVIPFYSELVETAVGARRALAELRASVAEALKELRVAGPEDLEWHARRLERELDRFGGDRAYHSLKVQDQRRVAELRHQLGKFVGTRVDRFDLIAAVDAFEAFLSSLLWTYEQELLAAHDREVIAACGVTAERVGQLLASEPAEASRLLEEAIARAGALRGRDPELDALLREGAASGLTQERLSRFLALLAQLAG